MPLPNFLIIGAQKSGTSWLARNLSDHPEIFMASSELYFFNDREHFNKGNKWYENCFTQVKNEPLIGEKTPGYLCHSDACLRIYRTLPEVKLIAILRNPIERAISAINHHKRKGRISPLQNTNSLLLGILHGDRKYLAEELNYRFVSRGKYYSQLKAYYDYFDSDQILVLNYEEDIVNAPTQTLKKVCDFLGADLNFEFKNINTRVNSNNMSLAELSLNYYLPFLKPVNHRIGQLLPKLHLDHLDDLEETTIYELKNVYSEENKKLFTLLDKKISSWE